MIMELFQTVVGITGTSAAPLLGSQPRNCTRTLVRKCQIGGASTAGNVTSRPHTTASLHVAKTTIFTMPSYPGLLQSREHLRLCSPLLKIQPSKRSNHSAAIRLMRLSHDPQNWIPRHRNISKVYPVPLRDGNWKNITMSGL